MIVIGHGALRSERQYLVTRFRKEIPVVAIVSLLRSTDEPFIEADFNIPADNPPLWKGPCFKPWQDCSERANLPTL